MDRLQMDSEMDWLDVADKERDEATPWLWQGWQENEDAGMTLQNTSSSRDVAFTSASEPTEAAVAYSAINDQRATIWFSVSALAYAMSCLIFLARAYILLCSSGIDCIVESAVALVYGVVGVMLPLLSLSRSRSGAMRCILFHRMHYSECVFLEDLRMGMRMFVRIAKYIGPVCGIVGLVAPAEAAKQLWRYREQGDKLYRLDQSFLVFACTYAGLFGMLVFGSSRDELVYNACYVAIRGFILEIRGEAHPVDAVEGPVFPQVSADFCHLAKHQFRLHEALADVWSVNCFGCPWVIRISLFFGGSLILAAKSIERDATLPWTYRTAGLGLAMGGLILLVRLAELTKICTGKITGGQTIISASTAYAHQTNVFADDELQKYQVFLSYISLHPVHIRLCGVDIDWPLVVNFGTKMAVQIPFLVTILATLLHHDRESAV